MFLVRVEYSMHFGLLKESWTLNIIFMYNYAITTVQASATQELSYLLVQKVSAQWFTFVDFAHGHHDFAACYFSLFSIFADKIFDMLAHFYKSSSGTRALISKGIAE